MLEHYIAPNIFYQVLRLMRAPLKKPQQVTSGTFILEFLAYELPSRNHSRSHQVTETRGTFMLEFLAYVSVALCSLNSTYLHLIFWLPVQTGRLPYFWYRIVS